MQFWRVVYNGLTFIFKRCKDERLTGLTRFIIVTAVDDSNPLFVIWLFSSLLVSSVHFFKGS